MLGFFTGEDDEEEQRRQSAGGYAPAMPLPMGGGMPQQGFGGLLSPQQQSGVDAFMSPDRVKMEAAEMIRRLGGADHEKMFLNQPPSYFNVPRMPDKTPAYQHYSATAEPSSPGFIASQSNRMDDAYRSQQFVGPMPEQMGPPMPQSGMGMQQSPAAQSLASLLPGGHPTPQMPDEPVRITGGDGSGYVSSFNPNFRSDPFMAKDSFMADGPIQTLGVNGFRTGSSRPTYDDSGMMQRAGIDRYNMQLGNMLGQQDIARSSNQNDLMRTLLGVQSRNDIASDRETGRFLGLIDKIPEGNRTPAIEEAVRKGAIDKSTGSEMLMNEMLTRAKRAGKTDKGIDTGKFLGSLAAEFDPGRMNKGDLIKKIQQMGYSADQLAAFENDPVAGPMVRSILGPAVPYQTTGLDAIMKDFGSGKFWQDARNTPGAVADSFMNLFR